MSQCWQATVWLNTTGVNNSRPILAAFWPKPHWQRHRFFLVLNDTLKEHSEWWTSGGEGISEWATEERYRLRFAFFFWPNAFHPQVVDGLSTGFFFCEATCEPENKKTEALYMQFNIQGSSNKLPLAFQCLSSKKSRNVLRKDPDNAPPQHTSFDTVLILFNPHRLSILQRDQHVDVIQRPCLTNTFLPAKHCPAVFYEL